ncbi:Ger(x)C family spore germination protein [Paenibacillus sp. LHD-117]|uniref:Ger(x)C family spore germination protein n=1 Tax=Paenibacillus sp. LHD-117 TaxID=3071412 RepID=UPI0027E0D8CE|nr:Ger(x)C family spore germination protein [Paenibacillus sp. LHD-117]MDQ6419526.1 Ger(x)C family spore germination protein [Paenibacillus sp. LHD-117]
MNRKFGISVCAGLILFMLTGCWNYREMNDLSLALAEGVDKVPGKKEYRFSFQLVNAQEIAGLKAAGNTPVVVYSGTGKTLLEAVRKASKLVPRRITGQHLRVLVIGEELAKESIGEVFDLMERDPEPRMTTRVFIAKRTTAESILRTVTPLELIPANALLGKLKVSGKVLGEGFETEITDIIRGLMSKEKSTVISGIKLTGSIQTGQGVNNLKRTTPPSQLLASGMALFKDGKLAGWANGDAARGITWLNNKIKSTVVNVDCEDISDAVAIELLHSKIKLNARLAGERPEMNIHIHQVGFIEEAMCSVDLSKSATIRDFEQKWNEETSRIVLAGVKKAQELKTDVVGFGEALERSNPKVWKTMEEDWANIFPSCKVEIEVDSSIRRTGMVARPYMFKEKQPEPKQ